MSIRTLIFLFFLIPNISAKGEDGIRGVVFVGPKSVQFGAARFVRGNFERILYDSYRLETWEDLNASPNQNLSLYRLKRTCSSVRRAIDALKRKDATKIKVFLAPIFLEVRNLKSLQEDLKKLGYPVSVLTETKYRSALSVGYQMRTDHRGHAIIWDMGFDAARIQSRQGSSGPMETLGIGPGRVQVARGIRNSWSYSPNPLSPEKTKEALKYFEDVLMGNPFTKNLEMGGKVFGTGHQFRRLGQYAASEEGVVTLKRIDATLDTVINKPDRKIPLLDSENDVIRLLTVKAIMEKKKIREIQILTEVKVHGLLVGTYFWEDDK